MFTWNVSLLYVEGYGDGTVWEHYYVQAENEVSAIDKALSSFLDEFGLDFDDDIDNIEWDCTRVG